jgi:hypothetical protein
VATLVIRLSRTAIRRGSEALFHRQLTFCFFHVGTADEKIFRVAEYSLLFSKKDENSAKAQKTNIMLGIQGIKLHVTLFCNCFKVLGNFNNHIIKMKFPAFSA